MTLWRNSIETEKKEKLMTVSEINENIIDVKCLRERREENSEGNKAEKNRSVLSGEMREENEGR